MATAHPVPQSPGLTWVPFLHPQGTSLATPGPTTQAGAPRAGSAGPAMRNSQHAPHTFLDDP